MVKDRAKNGTIDLTNKRFVILGMQGYGKSVLAKHILKSTDRHLVYDPLNEYIGYRRYVPIDRHSVEELDQFIDETVIPWQPELFVLDEASRYVPRSPARLPVAVGDLVDLSRHWGIAWGAICRRPSQLHTDLRELAHVIFVFRLGGKNDHASLNSWHDGMGDVVRGLPDYHFAVLEAEKLTVHEPVEYTP